MNITEVEINNARDIPYGPLHNDFKFNLKIGDKKWDSISNYIYSNMVTSTTHKVSLEKVDTLAVPKKTDRIQKIEAAIANREKMLVGGNKLSDYERGVIERQVDNEIFLQSSDINKIYKYYTQEEQKQAIKSALEKGYRARMEDEDFVKQLETLYNKGLNIVGLEDHKILGDNNTEFFNETISIILQQLVYEYIQKNNTERVQRHIKNIIDNRYDIYRAIRILEYEISNMIKNKNAKYLKNYENKTPLQVIEEFLKKYNSTETKDDILRKLNISEEYKQYIIKLNSTNVNPIFSEIEKQPDQITAIVLNNNRERIIQQVRILEKKIVAEKYTKYIIDTDFKGKKVNDPLFELKLGCIDPQDGNVSETEFNDIKNQIYSCYENGKFPEQLKSDIEKELENLKALIPVGKIDKTSMESKTSETESEDVIVNTFKEEKQKEKEKEKQWQVKFKNDIIGTYSGEISEEELKKMANEYNRNKEDKDKIQFAKRGYPLNIKIIDLNTPPDKDKPFESLLNKQPEEILYEIKQERKQDIITISQFNIISPFYNKNLTVENRSFGDIMKLVYFKLYIISASSMSNKNILSKGSTADEAFEKIKDTTTSQLYKKYIQHYTDTEKKLFKYHLSYSLKIKFKNKFMLSLLNTLNVKINYESKSGGIINEITSQQLNEIKDNNNIEDIPIRSDISISDLYTVLSGEEFFSKWYSNKISEFAKTVFKYSENSDIKVDINFVKAVIDNIYPQFKLVDKISGSEKEIKNTKAILLAVSDEINFVTEVDYISARKSLIEKYDSIMVPSTLKTNARNIIDVYEALSKQAGTLGKESKQQFERDIAKRIIQKQVEKEKQAVKSTKVQIEQMIHNGQGKKDIFNLIVESKRELLKDTFDQLQRFDFILFLQSLGKKQENQLLTVSQDVQLLNYLVQFNISIEKIKILYPELSNKINTVQQVLPLASEILSFKAETNIYSDTEMKQIEKFLNKQIQERKSRFPDKVNKAATDKFMKDIVELENKMSKEVVGISKLQQDIAQYFFETIFSPIVYLVRKEIIKDVQQLNIYLAQSQYTISDEKFCRGENIDNIIEKDLDCIFSAVTNILNNCKKIKKGDDVQKSDIDFAVSLILNLPLKTSFQQKEYEIKEEDRDEYLSEIKYITEEEEKDQQGDELDEQGDELDEQGDEQYSEEDIMERLIQEVFEDNEEFSMRTGTVEKQVFDDKIQSYYIGKIDLERYNIASQYIWNAIVYIYNHNMNLHLKFMRINFFASIN